MTKKEIIERLKVIKDDIDTMISFAKDPDLMGCMNLYGDDTVSEFYKTYEDDPEYLVNVMKSLKEDFKVMKMKEFARMD